MKSFSKLIIELDQTNKTNAKVEALANYFSSVKNDNDKLWALALLSGRRPKRTVNTTKLWEWANEKAELPEWLFAECYQIVGDLAETIAMLLPDNKQAPEKSLTTWITTINQLKDADDLLRKEKITEAWSELDYYERFVFNKLITGNFRIGVSQKLVTKSLSKVHGVDENVLTHRLMGNWSPDNISYNDLIQSTGEMEDISRPYPFFLAYALEQEPSELGNEKDWQAEWKWDGIRGQLIKRKGEIFLWSRGEDLITEKFPELLELGKVLPEGTVIDGEILPYKEGKPLSFNLLQTRIGRKNVTGKILKEVPVVLLAYDILEWEGKDVRNAPLKERRGMLEKLVQQINRPDQLVISQTINFSTWDELTEIRKSSRDMQSEGIMLKKLDSNYETGRKRGNWWKWKIDPLTIDAVLIYAQRGHGRRANLYTDYTFAVWDENKQLIPFTKAYSGLTDKELMQVDAFVKKNTKEKFGPVRSVKPELVFEIAFEGIAKSPRHKSGIALRFPRILRWRHDKPIEEADTLVNLRKMLEQYGS